MPHASSARQITTLFVLSYLAGSLTILAPCILPLAPFVFARADQPVIRIGLPLLAGMALTFAAVATTVCAAYAEDHQRQAWTSANALPAAELFRSTEG